jgi:hypothetical protein
MKRIRLLVLLGLVAIALPLGLLSGVAKATGGTTTNQVTIDQKAQYDLDGTILFVGLRVRCKPSSLTELGQVFVRVQQYYPETPYGDADGDGHQSVVCDNTTHTVGVTINGIIYDEGRALATAVLVPPGADLLTGQGTVTTKKWIDIVVMSGS